MKDFQRAADVQAGQFVLIERDGTWTPTAKVVSVQHNRLCGNTPSGEQIRGVVMLFADDTVASMDDDTIVQVHMDVAHA